MAGSDPVRCSPLAHDGAARLADRRWPQRGRGLQQGGLRRRDGGVNPAAVIASRTRGVASRASSRSSKDFIRFSNVVFRPCVTPATPRAPASVTLGSSLRYSPARSDESLRKREPQIRLPPMAICLVVAQWRNTSRLRTPALGRNVLVSQKPTIKAALKREARWCVCLHLHHRNVFATGTAT
jgi:hypothetical protein